MAIDQAISGARDDDRFEQIAGELAELRAENDRQAAEIQQLRAGALERDQVSAPPRRARRRKVDVAQASVSRRRMFGMLGGAAAAGTGLAVAGSLLGSEPAGATIVTAGAANGDALQIGGGNTCVADTTLSSPGTNGVTFMATAGATNGTGVKGVANGSGVNASGVAGYAPFGYGVVAIASGVAPLLIGTAGITGAPSTGTHQIGEFVVDQTGVLFYCVTAGTPGTWVRQAPLVTLPAPVRVFDSRTGQPNQSPNTQGALTFTAAPPSSALRTVACNKDAASGTLVVPAGARTLLLNLTATGTVGTGALVAYATGATQPSASSINWTSDGLSIANSVTSACNATQNVDVAIVAGAGASTNFIMDVVGYYR